MPLALLPIKKIRIGKKKNFKISHGPIYFFLVHLGMIWIFFFFDESVRILLS